MFKVIRKADILLFCLLILTAGALSAVFTVRLKEPASLVVITADGEPYGTYSLNEDREITVTGNGFHNVIRIENGTVRMESSDCHNQVCVEHAPISRSGESIICLPHKLVVRIEGGKEAQYDAIVR